MAAASLSAPATTPMLRQPDAFHENNEIETTVATSFYAHAAIAVTPKRENAVSCPSNDLPTNKQNNYIATMNRS
jgi:hypothetical protein